MEIAYPIADKLYICITERTNTSKSKPTDEPSIYELIRHVFTYCLAEYSEIVFVPNGEPTLRIEVLVSLIRKIRAVNSSASIRLITNGLGNKYNGRDITSELSGMVDTLSIDMNDFDERNSDIIADFTQRAMRYVPHVEFILSHKKEMTETCRLFAESCGAEFNLYDLQ